MPGLMPGLMLEADSRVRRIAVHGVPILSTATTLQLEREPSIEKRLFSSQLRRDWFCAQNRIH